MLVTNLSNNSTTSTTLDEATNAIGRSLATGHLPSLAEAIMDHKGLADVVLQLLLNKLESECAALSQRSPPLSLKQNSNSHTKARIMGSIHLLLIS